MAKRFKIGLIYSYNKDWVAGAYYILNLVHALKKIPGELKPELIILSYSEEEFNTVKETGYPHLFFKKLIEKDFWPTYTITERILNKISRAIIGRNIVRREHTYKRFNLKLDVLFPASNHVYFSNVPNKLFWIPDFQEHFLPHFFSEEEIRLRGGHQKKIAGNGYPIVFSSNDALNQFKKLYPDSKSPVFVLQFAVTHPIYENIKIDDLLEKFKINRPYFFCPNQFWAHKNHIVVLKALKKIKYLGNDALVVFSGNEYDYRNPDFFKEIKQFVSENKIEDQVRFLGFIDRSEQLQLMNNSLAVIQPSLFEGWSTVIEDAKAMNKFVIASNLEVHKEQLKKNSAFFDPSDPEELMKLIDSYSNKVPETLPFDYKSDVKKFGSTFFNIVQQLNS